MYVNVVYILMKKGEQLGFKKKEGKFIKGFDINLSTVRKVLGLNTFLVKGFFLKCRLSR